MAIEAETLVTTFKGDDRHLQRSFAAVERATGQHLTKVEGLYRNAQGRLVSASNAMASSAGGGILPGLANLSSIIRGIPQIGQLAGALIQPLTDAAEEGVRFNMLIESATVGFRGLTGGVKESAAYVKQLTDFAAANPIFNTQGTIEAARMMSVFGFETKKTTEYIKEWGSALAAGGRFNNENLMGIVTAFGQMRSKGKVSAEEMMQLAERGIPSWELLAKAINKTTAETMKLGEQGRLNGPAAVDAITAMLKTDPRFAGQADAFAGTLEGRLAQASDLKEVALGRATQSLTKGLNDALATALSGDNTELVNRMAAGIDSALVPVAGIITASAKGLLGGGLTAGFAEGIQAGKAMVSEKLGSLIVDGVIGQAKEWLGINSPSTVFIGIGENIGAGLSIGFANGLDDPTYTTMIDGALTKLQQRVYRKMIDLFKREPEFLSKLIEGATKRGIDPDHLLNVMAIETAGTFNPAVTNPLGYTGLIQFGKAAAKDLGTTTGTLRGMSGTEQLDYVFRYLDQHLAGLIGKGPVSQAQLYAAVGAGSAGRNDQAVKFRAGTRGYELNQKSWDVNRDGLIQQWEFGPAAQMKLGAGVKFTVNGGDVSNSNPLPVSMTGPVLRQLVDALGMMADRLPEKGRPMLVTLASGGEFGGGLFQQPGRTIVDNVPVNINVSAPPELLSTGLGNMVPASVLEGLLGTGGRGAIPGSGAGQTDDWAKRVVMKNEDMGARLREQWHGMSESFQDIFVSNMSRSFEGGFMQSAGNVLIGFTDMLNQMALRALAANVGKLLFGGVDAEGKTTGGGGIFGKLLGSILPSVFGAAFGGGGSFSSILSGFSSGPLTSSGLANANFGAIPLRADGGTVSPFQMYKINERENEFLYMGKNSGHVVNQRQMAQMQPQGGDTTVNINMYANPQTGAFSKQSAEQAARAAMSQMDHVRRRSSG